MPNMRGQRVDKLRTVLAQVRGLVHRPVQPQRRRVNNPDLYTNLSNFCTQLLRTQNNSFASVISDLSALCTGPIITITIKLRRI